MKLLDKRRSQIGTTKHMYVRASELLDKPTGKRLKAKAAVDTRFATNAEKGEGLCKDLMTDLYKDELFEIAKELDIPITTKTTKKDLCDLIGLYAQQANIPLPSENLPEEQAESILQKELAHRRNPDILFDPNDSFEEKFKSYGYIDNRRSLPGFVLVDVMNQLKPSNNRLLNRYLRKGRPCILFTKYELGYILETLSTIPKIFTKEEVQTLQQSAEIAKRGSHDISKATICQLIEDTLRILNDRDHNRTWFLLPGDQARIEYDTSGRHFIKLRGN